MTDQDAYTLAGWIERARKAEAALTANGFIRHQSSGVWVSCRNPQEAKAPPGLPPIDYDTKS